MKVTALIAAMCNRLLAIGEGMINHQTMTIMR